MENLELTVEGERFRVSERLSDDGIPSYDFDWLNGPGEDRYGFTIGLVPLGKDSADADVLTRLSPEQLHEQALHFVKTFYEPGGVRDEDFPHHIAARDLNGLPE